MKTLLVKDLDSYTSRELDILANSIKEQKDRRRAEFIGQFHEGFPYAIQDANNNWVPVYAMDVNKASVRFIQADTDNKLSKYHRVFTLRADELNGFVDGEIILKVTVSKTIEPLQTMMQQDIARFVENKTKGE